MPGPRSESQETRSVDRVCDLFCVVIGAVVGVVRLGRLVARFDTARGHYEVLGTACQSIEFRTVALCIVSKSLVAVVGCCRWLLT